MNEPLCRAPWVTTYREQDGKVSPCCESSKPYEGVHASLTNEQIFRHPEVEKFKKQLLDGIWPDRCKNCKTQEERNQRSHRKVISHPRYERNFDVNSFHFRFIDHRSSNICNFSCKMCSEHLSSTHAIIKKASKFNFEMDKYPKNGVIEMPTNTQNIIDNIQDTKHLQFAGGEPLLMNSTWELLDMAIDEGVAENISVGLITNGSLLARNEEKIIDKLMHFKIAHITVSIDAIGEAHDYWRHKGTWNAVDQNMESLISQRVKDKFEVTVRTTIGWPTAWRAKEVFERYQGRIDNHFTGFINGPPEWSIQQLPQKEINKLAEYYKDWNDPYELFSNTKSNINHTQLRMAKKKLTMHDDYHKNNIIDIFPEHKDFIENHIMSLTLPD